MWIRVLGLICMPVAFAEVVVLIVPRTYREDAGWDLLIFWLAVVEIAGFVTLSVVIHAKKNADARWALEQSHTDALAAELAEFEEPAAR